MVWISLMFTIFLWLLATRLWSLYIRSTSDPCSTLPLPPGGTGLPFLGETLELAIKGYRFFRQRREQYGKIYLTHLFGRPTVRVFGSSNIEKILKSEEVMVTMWWPAAVQKLIGLGSLMVSQGEHHHLRRISLLEAFSEKSLSGNLAIIQTTVREYIQKWTSMGMILGQPEACYLAARLCTRTLFGYEYNSREVLKITDAISVIEKGFFTLPLEFPQSPFSKGMVARKALLDMIEKAIESHTNGNSQSQKRCVLKLLLVDRDGLTREEIKDTCLEMLFLSVEGISSAVCTLLLQIASHPETTQHASQELDQLGLMEQQNAGDISVDKLEAAVYVSRLVKEVLRLTPPVGGGYRNVLRTMEIGGYQIPRGWAVLYSIRDQHETGTEKSQSFDPDRWIPERDVSKLDDYSYIPFGGTGSRSCIGRQFALTCLRVTAIEMIRGCSWSLLEANPVMKFFPVPYPSNSMPLRVTEFNPRARRVTL